MNRDPSTQKDSGNATPNNVPNHTTMRKVGAVVFCQRTVVDRQNGVCVNRGPLHQVVAKRRNNIARYAGMEMERADVGLMCQLLSRSILKRLRVLNTC